MKTVWVPVVVGVFVAVLVGLNLAGFGDGRHDVLTHSTSAGKGKEESPSLDRSDSSLGKRLAVNGQVESVPESAAIVESLLTQYELTGDPSKLREAQNKSADDVQVLLVSAMAAQLPQDEWLQRLEASQPDNALPNLLRAGLLADGRHADQFRDQFLKAVSKTKLDTGSRARYGMLVDEVLATGQLPRTLILGSDQAYFKKLENIVRFLHDSPLLFGTEDLTATYALAFAQQLRHQGGPLDLSSRFASTITELDVLDRFSDSDLYGTTGLTVADRRRELKPFGEFYHNKVLTSEYSELLSNPGKNPVLSMQFLARLRADGQNSAVRWLLKQKGVR